MARPPRGRGGWGLDRGGHGGAARIRGVANGGRTARGASSPVSGGGARSSGQSYAAQGTMARGEWAITEGQQAMEGDGGALAAPEDRGDGGPHHGGQWRRSLARGLPVGRLLPWRAIGVGWGWMA